MSKSNRLLLLALASIFLVVSGWRYFQPRQSGQVVTGIAQNPQDNLRNIDGRTNVVFLGIGGKEHVGGDLTDSIILFSYAHSTQQLSLIPIPRDIWVPSLQAKINTAFHYGGIPLMESAIGEITGLVVNYTVVLDFQGFENMIDAIGGIDVTVKQTFDDYLYPIPGNETVEPESSRYEHLHFEEGPAHFNGATALKFARSRHAEGDEGTDFARSKRQEQVILAFKDKLFSSQTLLKLSTLQNLVANVQDSLITNINSVETGAFIRLFLDYPKNNSAPKSIDLTSLYLNPTNKLTYAGQWVLVPVTTSEDIHAYVAKNLY